MPMLAYGAMMIRRQYRLHPFGFGRLGGMAAALAWRIWLTSLTSVTCRSNLRGIGTYRLTVNLRGKAGWMDVGLPVLLLYVLKDIYNK